MMHVTCRPQLKTVSPTRSLDLRCTGAPCGRAMSTRTPSIQPQAEPESPPKSAAILAIDAARAQHQARALVARARFASVATIVALALVIALTLRSLVFEPFTLISPSMQPGLTTGDYLFVAKWPYGYSRYSLPFSLPLLEGRVPGGRGPARGDVVVFKSAFDNRTDYIKRVIGLPGDRVELRRGQIILNGKPVPQRMLSDNAACTPAAGPCPPAYFHERLPGRRGYVIADHVDAGRYDTTAAIIVPAGHYFVLGDNRDDSADSRVALSDGGVGMIPAANIIGRADRVFFSIDADALDWSPASWLRAVRTARIGAQF